jgi:[ribosomal protein S5]-alanine N-acetyltransferase
MKIVLREWKDDDKIPLTQLANNKLIADNLRDHFPHSYSLKDAEEWIALNKSNIPIMLLKQMVNWLVVVGYF